MRTRALLATCGVLIAAAMPAILAGGCTGMSTESKTAAMAPAPRAKATAGPASYAPVTDQRLLNPEPENWLMYRRQLRRLGLQSARARSRPRTRQRWCRCGRSRPAWPRAIRRRPIVNNGVMFVTTPQNQVLALDAKSGELLWRYKQELPEDLFQLHPTNRGVGLYEDKVYLATLDAHVVALDAKTGKVVWDTDGGGLQEGLLHAPWRPSSPRARSWSAPRAASSASAASSGPRRANRQARRGGRTRSPRRASPGSDTWNGRRRGRRAGCRCGSPGTYDPQLNLTYWGTGNAAPVVGRPAPRRQPLLGVGDGARRRHRQDPRLSPVPLERLVGLGRGLGAHADRRASAGAGRSRASCIRRRNGYLWLLERARRRHRVRRRQALRQPGSVHEHRSRDRAARPTTPSRSRAPARRSTFCPSLWGGKDWPPAAYNPKTGLPLHSRQREPVRHPRRRRAEPYEPGKLWLGVETKDIGMDVSARAPTTSASSRRGT